MCGITCVWGKNSAVKAVKILKSQENRGTSSTGLAYVKNGKIVILKDTISPTRFEETFNKEINSIESQIVIGHNRMPSVGGVTHENAHPFLSCNGDFALVHNGSVGELDSDKIRYLLKNLGHEFQGQTDSEVIMHIFGQLLERYNNDIIQAIQKLREIIGYYESILVIFKSGEVYGFGSNVKIIEENGEIYLGSEEESFSGLFENQTKTILSPERETIFKIKDGKLIWYGEKREESCVITKRQTKYIWYYKDYEDDYDEENYDEEDYADEDYGKWLEKKAVKKFRDKKSKKKKKKKHKTEPKVYGYKLGYIFRGGKRIKKWVRVKL